MRALLLGFEQANVLDRNHCLVGEGGDQLDLPLGERINPGTCQKQNPDRSSLTQERNTERGAIVSDQYEAAQIILRISLNIEDVNRFCLKQSPADDCSSTRLYGYALQIPFVLQPLFGFACNSIARDQTVAASLWPPNVRHFCVAQPRRRFDQCIEHALQVEGRAADN